MEHSNVDPVNQQRTVTAGDDHNHLLIYRLLEPRYLNTPSSSGWREGSAVDNTWSDNNGDDDFGGSG